MKTPKLEIACFDIISTLTAEKGGADRVELCRGFDEGGISPHIEDVLLARDSLSIPFYVMIRPRAGDFIYYDEEFEKMQSEISDFKKAGAKGFVFGILKRTANPVIPREQEVDVKRCKALVRLASPLPCTFHRAFDKIANTEQGLEDIIQCGFKAILTSGKAETALGEPGA